MMTDLFTDSNQVVQKLKFVLLQSAIKKINPNRGVISAPNLPGSFERGENAFEIKKRKSGNFFIDSLTENDLPWHQLADGPQLREMALRAETNQVVPSIKLKV